MGINPLVLPAIVALAAGVMNLLPWGGPTARAMSVLLPASIRFLCRAASGDRHPVGVLRRVVDGSASADDWRLSRSQSRSAT